MLTTSQSDSKRVEQLPEYEEKRKELPSPCWVTENTAILVTHGIGHQRPIETLDQFSRGIIERYQTLFPGQISYEHILDPVDESKSVAFHNIIRIKHKKYPDTYIDIHEYYWAYCTQERADLTDINAWIQGVADGARKYYRKQNEDLGKRFSDDSIFFEHGKFLSWKYDLFLNTMIKTYLFVNFIVTTLLKLISFIPLIGAIAQTIFKRYIDTVAYKLSNLVGDIVIYNVTDEKSRFYPIRKQILEGATSALQRLLQKTERDKLFYPSVFVAGHSLGSEIAYDAINRINLLANAGKLKHYMKDGSFDTSVSIKEPPSTLSNQIKGFITFGSPLDKIAFFLRQIVDESNYVWQQVVDNYHCFKQGQWTLPFTGNKRMEASSVKRLLDGVKWVNYFDGDDIVSGRLDYFTNLTNVECKFNCSKLFSNNKSRFTHSHYWMCGDFYEHIIRNLLSQCDRAEFETRQVLAAELDRIEGV